jgi:hypothetical protein
MVLALIYTKVGMAKRATFWVRAASLGVDRESDQCSRLLRLGLPPKAR